MPEARFEKGAGGPEGQSVAGRRRALLLGSCSLLRPSPVRLQGTGELCLTRAEGKDPETPEREEKGVEWGVGVLGARAMSVRSVTAREGRQPAAERCLLLIRLQRLKWFWGRLKPVGVNPSLFPFPRFGAPLLGTGPKFTSRLGAVALSCARGAGRLPELREGGRWQREGRSPAFLSGKKEKAFSCELWPCTGAAVEFGQPLGPRRRQRGASWQSRAAGDVAVRCPERPSLPAAKSRVWKGAELLLTGRWKAVLLWEQPLLGCSHTKNAEAPSVVDGERKLGGTLRS